jgi:kynurenine formamidase
LSEITRPTDPLLAAVSAGVRAYDLGREMFIGMPQSQEHVPFRMAIGRRHGDRVRVDGTSGASEIIITGGHVGTHVDAIAHVSHEGLLHGGIDAGAACVGGRYAEGGVEEVEPILGRGILLDVPRALGVELCEAAYEITVEDLEVTLARSGVTPAPGDVILVRTGWGSIWDDGERFSGEVDGAPGPGEAGCRWLADLQPAAVGGDTVAFERISPARVAPSLRGHRVLIVESGIPIIEMLDLEELAAAEVVEFLFVLSPLKLLGATGSPVRPLALVTDSASDFKGQIWPQRSEGPEGE